MANLPKSMIDYRSGFTEFLKQYKDEDDSITYWENLLLNPTQNYQASVQQAQTTRDYDISGAYANWKQNQLKLMQSSHLGTGVKSEIGSSLQSAYENQFTQAQKQFLTTEASARQDYLKSMSAAEEQVNKQAEVLAAGLPSIIKYASEKYDLGYDNEALFDVPVDKGGYGLLVRDKTGGYSISDELSAYIDRALSEETYVDPKTGEVKHSFASWLADQGDNEDFLNLYTENPEMVAAALGGSRARDLEWSDKEKDQDKILDVKRAINVSDVYKKAGWTTAKGFDSKALTDLSKILNDAYGDSLDISFEKTKKVSGSGRGLRIRDTGVAIHVKNINDAETLKTLEEQGFVKDKNGYYTLKIGNDADNFKKILDNIYTITAK